MFKKEFKNNNNLNKCKLINKKCNKLNKEDKKKNN